MKKAIWMGIGCVLMSAPAFAQQGGPEPSQVANPTPAEESGFQMRSSALPFRRNSISVGAGVLGYFSGAAPGTSGAWDARYRFAASRIISLEGGYIGAAGDAAVGGAAIATIVEGDLQIRPLGMDRFNAFVLAGGGWGGFHATGSTGYTDNTFVLPLGVGAEYRLKDRLVADARFTYRLATGDGFGPQNADLDSWAFVGKVGTEF